MADSGVDSGLTDLLVRLFQPARARQVILETHTGPRKVNSLLDAPPYTLAPARHRPSSPVAGRNAPGQAFPLRPRSSPPAATAAHSGRGRSAPVPAHVRRSCCRPPLA